MSRILRIGVLGLALAVVPLAMPSTSEAAAVCVTPAAPCFVPTYRPAFTFRHGWRVNRHVRHFHYGHRHYRR